MSVYKHLYIIYIIYIYINEKSSPWYIFRYPTGYPPEKRGIFVFVMFIWLCKQDLFTNTNAHTYFSNKNFIFLKAIIINESIIVVSLEWNLKSWWVVYDHVQDSVFLSFCSCLVYHFACTWLFQWRYAVSTKE
jgi:hypothetical protein